MAAVCDPTVGSGIVGLLLWATRVQKAPNMEPALWKALAPVALFHTLGCGAIDLLISPEKTKNAASLHHPLLHISFQPYLLFLTLIQ